jgi:hypothetical protein
MNLELLRKEVPAAFATAPRPGVSSKYVFIGTEPVIASLAEAGWSVMGGKQTKSRIKDKEPYARHMLRFRNESLLPITDPRGKDLHMELVLVNGHDGSATYTLHAGLFSFLCLNGLVVGTMLESIRVRHMGMEATLEAVNSGASRLISTEMPKLGAAVTQMRGTLLSDERRLEFAKHALALRYKGVTSVLQPEQLLDVHREEDAANDVWTTLNVIQENVLTRKHHGTSFTGRATNIRGVSAVRESVAINRGLWDYAHKLAA